MISLFNVYQVCNMRMKLHRGMSLRKPYFTTLIRFNQKQIIKNLMKVIEKMLILYLISSYCDIIRCRAIQSNDKQVTM